MQNIIDKCVEPSRILLVILLAVVIAQTGWFFVTGPEPIAVRAQTPSQTAIKRSVMGSAAIGGLNLFGKALSDKIAVVQSNFNASQTRLRLELQAVFQAEHPEDSAAIVAEAKRPGLLYKVGKKMPGNAILQEVYPDRIVLKRGGVFETLRFPKTNELLTRSKGRQAAQGSNKGVQSPVRLAQGNFQARDLVNSPTTPVSSGSTQGDLKSMMKQFQTNLENDPKTTLAQIGVTPVNPNGSEGYRLGGLASSPYLKQTGLQANDVILSVNNQPVGNVQEDRLRIANVLAQGSARLEVQRGERRFFVTASLK